MSGFRRGSSSRVAVWAVQVVVQRPVGRGAALLVGVDGVGLVGGVGAEQVVEGVPAGGVLADQARPGQLGQQWSCLWCG